MPVFDYAFEVAAGAESVAAFHEDARVLRALTPAPVQIHVLEPLADGSVAEFTVWTPIPIRWRAVHRDVGPNGFTDVQDRGPLRSWAHTHRFDPITEDRTLIREHIEYEYAPGWNGLIGRIGFSRPVLRLLFAYRAWRTRRAFSV